jgi:hypothetical protein
MAILDLSYSLQDMTYDTYDLCVNDFIVTSPWLTSSSALILRDSQPRLSIMRCHIDIQLKDDTSVRQ